MSIPNRTQEIKSNHSSGIVNGHNPDASESEFENTYEWISTHTDEEWATALVAGGVPPNIAATTVTDRTVVLETMRDKTNDVVLPFYTAAEVTNTTPENIDWIVQGLIAKGALTELDGKVKRSGKTTLSLAACRATLDEETFMGFPTTRTNIVYITEQAKTATLVALKRAHLENETNIHFLFRYDFKKRQWDYVIEQAMLKCRAVGAELIAVDTITKLAGVKKENDNADWDDALTPLMDATNEGFAVLMNRHSGKNPGEVGDSGRGHSSASGDPDIVLNLTRPEGNHPSNYRLLEGIGRFDEIPEKIIIAMNDGRYELIGTDSDVSMRVAMNFVIDALSNYPEGLPVTGNKETTTLTSLGMQGDTRVPKTNIIRAITEHERLAVVVRAGGGVRGDPFIYKIRSTELD